MFPYRFPDRSLRPDVKEEVACAPRGAHPRGFRPAAIPAVGGLEGHVPLSIVEVRKRVCQTFRRDDPCTDDRFPARRPVQRHPGARTRCVSIMHDHDVDMVPERGSAITHESVA